MPIYATTYCVDAEPLRVPFGPTKKLPNSQRILWLVSSDKWGTCGMFGHCLIHPVTPLLSPLAPLFPPLRSPVRGLGSVAINWGNRLILLVFSSDFACRAGPQKSFSPVIRAKTGDRRTARPGGAIATRPAPCHKDRRGQSAVVPRASGNRGRCPERWPSMAAFEWLPWAPAFAGATIRRLCNWITPSFAGMTGNVWRFPAGSVGRETFSLPDETPPPAGSV
jgi:hypothetical protein